MFTFHEGTTPEQVEAVAEGLSRLPALIPEIRGYRYGPDAGLAEGNASFAVVVDFDDLDGYRRYAEHPAHLEVAVALLRPLLAARSAVQMIL